MNEPFLLIELRYLTLTRTGANLPTAPQLVNKLLLLAQSAKDIPHSRRFSPENTIYQ
jgi:hypothetical protein